MNRWSFNQPAGSAATGTTVNDGISGLPAVIRGNGARFNGTALIFNSNGIGNATVANISAYLDLPNGILSAKTNFSIEAWVSGFSFSGVGSTLLAFGNSTVTSVHHVGNLLRSLDRRGPYPGLRSGPGASKFEERVDDAASPIESSLRPR